MASEQNVRLGNKDYEFSEFVRPIGNTSVKAHIGYRIDGKHLGLSLNKYLKIIWIVSNQNLLLSVCWVHKSWKVQIILSLFIILLDGKVPLLPKRTKEIINLN